MSTFDPTIKVKAPKFEAFDKVRLVRDAYANDLSLYVKGREGYVTNSSGYRGGSVRVRFPDGGGTAVFLARNLEKVPILSRWDRISK